jgi:hypothetical protein
MIVLENNKKTTEAMPEIYGKKQTMYQQKKRIENKQECKRSLKFSFSISIIKQ